MNLKFLAILSLAVVATSLIGDVQPAAARGWKYGVNNRQQRQANRIQQGVSNGSLNGRETRRLGREETALNNQEARFRASGNGLSQQERGRLEREQNALSHNIYQQKHDGQQGFGQGNGNYGGGNYGGGNNGGGNNGGGNNIGYNPNHHDQLFNINQTERNQEQRINNGIQSGELTNREAQRLETQQGRFDVKEAQMRQGGLTMQERREIDNAQDRMSRNIYEQKHDAQER